MEDNSMQLYGEVCSQVSQARNRIFGMIENAENREKQRNQEKQREKQLNKTVATIQYR